MQTANNAANSSQICCLIKAAMLKKFEGVKLRVRKTSHRKTELSKTVLTEFGEHTNSAHAVFGPFLTPSPLPTAFRQYIVTALLGPFLTPPPLPTAFVLKVCPLKEFNEQRFS